MARRRLGQVETFEDEAARRLSRYKLFRTPEPDQLALGNKFKEESSELFKRAGNLPYGSEEADEMRARAWALKDKAEQLSKPKFLLDTERIIRQWLDQTGENESYEANEQYWRTFLSQSTSFDSYAEEDDNSAYIASIFAVKPDPLGRFMLLDARFTGSRSLCYLAGANKLLMAAGYIDSGRYFDGSYARQHGLPGARIEKVGLGAAMYMATALGASMALAGIRGTASPSPDSPSHGRSEEADGVWEALNRNGSSSIEEDYREDEEEVETYHCANVRGESTTYETDNGEVDATVTSDEVCGDVVVEAPVSVDNGPVDKLPATALTKSKFLAFPSHGYGADGDVPLLRVDMDSRWNGEKVKRHTNIDNFRAFMETNIYGDSIYPTLSPVTCEMLTRALHGNSPRLAIFIAQTIKHNMPGPQGEDFIVTYLTRPDIAKIAKDHPKYAEYIGQKLLPGLSGLSLDARREIMRATKHYSSLGAVAYTKPNPMNFPKPSKELVSLVRRFGDGA